MSLRTRILLIYFCSFSIGFYVLVNWVIDDLRFRYLESVEEVMVDQAQLLASWVSLEWQQESLDIAQLRQWFDDAYQRRFSAQIYELQKDRIDLRVYLTNREGVVLFDSQSASEEGQDYSQWRDVLLTLKGLYGARSTRLDTADPQSSILHVAAPIIVNQEIVGALTVAKPKTNLNRFLGAAQATIIQVGLSALLAVLLLGIFFTSWITKPIRLLTQYANDIRDGKSAKLPSLDRSEIGEMGQAFEAMRESLENKHTIEHYIQTLTHELKGPLSGIRGAAELLEEELSPEQHQRFVKNIQHESERLQHIADQLFELSTLEHQTTLKETTHIELRQLFKELEGHLKVACSQKALRWSIVFASEKEVVEGNPFLLQKAFLNLLQNAIDFSPQGGEIRITVSSNQGEVVIWIEDEGPGIPEYAKEKVFQKFFSLQRPSTGVKSTGLGLNLSRAAISLHGGELDLGNRKEKGSRVVIRLPKSSFA